VRRCRSENVPLVQTDRPGLITDATRARLERARHAATAAECAAAIADLETQPATDRTALEWSALGRLYAQTARRSEAMAAYRAAAIVGPTSAAALCNASYGCRDEDREAEAIAVLRLAVRRDPHLADAWHNLAAALRNVGDLDIAAACFAYAATLWDEAITQVGLSEVSVELGDTATALAAAETAIARAMPGSATDVDARFTRGLAHLLNGDLIAGWDGYAARLEQPAFRITAPKGLPAWRGPHDRASHVYVWREQGIGDEVRFLSCLSDLARDVPRCTVHCSPRLAEIVMRSFPNVHVTATSTPPNDADAHVALGSLPQYYRPVVDAFPGTAYLVADDAAVVHWRARLADLGPERTIGLSWRSRVATNRRNLSYPDLASLRALTQLSNVTFIDLQYDHQPDELAELQSLLDGRLHHIDDLDLLNDIDGVLALCGALDGVISVGNTVVELAGAVGTPAAQLGSGHSPLTFGRTTSAWHARTTYCTKQPADPWSTALDAAVTVLTLQFSDQGKEQQ